MGPTRAGVLSLLTVVAAVGCSSDDGDDIINSLFRGSLSITANGGTATGVAGNTFGGDGGTLNVTSGRNLFVGINPSPLAPTLPSAPTTGTSVVSWTDNQTISTGNAIVNGNITADTTAFDATLTVTTGDLVINGSITSGDNGNVETGIIIDVPAGTVWILGTIRTGRIDGVNDGDEAGEVDIRALRIIFAGTIDARGEDGGTAIGRNGGSVVFDTEGPGTGPTSQILRGGSMLLSGGNASGLDAQGGTGGTFLSYRTFASSGAIHINGTTISCDGGTATGSGVVVGGGGGSIDLQGDAGVFFNATYSGRGGNASATTGEAHGGSGGAAFFNDLAVADSGPVAVFGSIDHSGGSASGGSLIATAGNAGPFTLFSGSDVNFGTGTYSHRGGNTSGRASNGGDASFSAGGSIGASGDLYFDAVLDTSDGNGGEEHGSGAAGFIDFDTVQGDIQISGSITSNGGNGSFDAALVGGPSNGGTVAAVTGPGGGSITVRATIRVNGGSDSNGSDDNDGAPGGLVQFLAVNSTGSIYVEPGSLLQAHGGNAGGLTSAPFGGDAGQIQLLTGGGSVLDGTIGGNISMRGTIAARGGAGLGFVGSFGGFGGEILIESDSPASVGGGGDGRGGDITLHAGATIDASGGSAGSGGDGLNDGTVDVTTPVAVIFDADGDDSDLPGENGIVLNLGIIISRGTGPGAFGGDVLFDGLDSLLAPGPLPGFLDLFGDGDVGDFLSQ